MIYYIYNTYNAYLRRMYQGQQVPQEASEGAIEPHGHPQPRGVALVRFRREGADEVVEGPFWVKTDRERERE